MMSLLDSWAENAEPLVCCIETIYQAGDIPAGRGNIFANCGAPAFAFWEKPDRKRDSPSFADVRQPGTRDFQNWAMLSLISSLPEDCPIYKYFAK
jgi:hypothetical protein